MLQSLQQMASTFAGIVASFCNSLQWDTLSLIVSQFKERLYFGIHRDLIDLMRLPDLNHKRARALFDAGITSLIELASADILNIEKILFNSLCFDSAKKHDNENEFEAAQRNKERNLFITGKTGLNVAEAAKLLIQDARRFVQYEIGVENIKWSQSENGLSRIDSNNEHELHMSCEENKFIKVKTNESQGKIKETQRKSSEKMHPERVKQDDINPYVEKTLAQQNDVRLIETPKPMINSHKHNPSIKSEKLEEECIVNQKRNDSKPKDYKKCLDESQSKHFKKPSTEQNNSAMLTSQHSHLKENNITFEDDSQVLKAMNAIEENVFTNNRSQQNDNVKHSLEKRKSIEKLKENLNVTPPKVLRICSNVEIKTVENEKTSSTTKDNNHIATITPTNVKEIDGRPSTSRKAQRLLRARQLSEMKKQEWAKRKEEKENYNTVDSKDISTLPNSICDTNAEKVSPKIKNPQETTQNIRSTPKITCNNAEQKTLKLPRRSPRNHSAQFARIDKHILSSATKASVNIKSPNNNIFGNDHEESFTINTDINEVLKEAENVQKPSLTEIKINSLEDEIPNSQQLMEDIPTNKTCSPHASRLFRTLRSTQKIQTPKPEANSKIVKIQEQEVLKLPKESSTSIELSDVSMDNSLLKHPLQLNASHILSCSKVENNSSSFKSIDIIDICGNQVLFKEAFKEFMDNKRLGFCLAVQQQCGRNKPIIGANLLLNQIAAAERKTDLAKAYEFPIDDCNYLAGIAFCITENTVYYMNMQPEGTCKGLTSEIKCKYLRTILKSSEHTLVVYDAKEQMKTLRKLLRELEEISVRLEDPKVANWLLEPDKMLNLHNLVSCF